jgi:hypothetical protein
MRPGSGLLESGSECTRPAYARAMREVIAPAQREHVANSFDDDALVPAVLQTFLKEDQIPDADLLPIPRQLGR